MASPSALRCSVVIPAYNCAAYVGQSIRSVLEQTIGSQYIELILVDDGSTDDTASVIRSFGDAVRLISVGHGGVSRARNAGITACSAPYIAFLDADDYWMPYFLERTLDRLSREERIFVLTDSFVDRNGVIDRVPYYRSRNLQCLFELDAAAQFEFAVEDNFLNCEAVVPRDAVLQAGGFNPRLSYGEDWDLWLRVLQLGYAARFVDEPCRVCRHMRPGSATSQIDVKRHEDRLYILAQYPDAVSPLRRQRARSSASRLRLTSIARRLMRRKVNV